MTYVLNRTWWFGNRWQVYEEDPDGACGPWLASFRYEADAVDFIRLRSRQENRR